MDRVSRAASLNLQPCRTRRHYARIATKHATSGPRSSRKVVRPVRQSSPLIQSGHEGAVASTSRLPLDQTLSPQQQLPTDNESNARLSWNDYNSVPTAQAESSAPQTQTLFDVPVKIPPDPNGLIQGNTPVANMLASSGLVVVRQLEMMNVFLGFEQANKYVISNAQGQTVGYLAEEELGLTNALSRQLLRTRRPFKCTIMDTQGRVTMRIRRPFQFINSSIQISLGENPDDVIGECRQEWHPWRRRYNLFQKRDQDFEQFARIDSPFLSWDFYATDSEGKPMASINRNWAGIGRELLTDTGQYVVRFDAVGSQPVPVQSQTPAPSQPEGSSASPGAESASNTAITDQTEYQVKDLTPIHEGITFDQRAILLATAMTLDVDYFSRHSSAGPSFLPFMMPFPFGGSQAPPENEGQEGRNADQELRGFSDDGREELPGSAEADAAARQHGWDENPLQEGNTMQDPFDTGETDVGEWE